MSIFLLGREIKYFIILYHNVSVTQALNRERKMGGSQIFQALSGNLALQKKIINTFKDAFYSYIDMQVSHFCKTQVQFSFIPHTSLVILQVKGKVTYLQMSSSGSSSPNLSSKVSCIHTFSSTATNLHTSTILRGYACGNLGLWILPLVVTVIIFSCCGSCTPTVETENKCVNINFFFS